MTIQLDINFDELDAWLTPENVENLFKSAGYDVELKDEFKKDFEEVQVKQFESKWIPIPVTINNSKHGFTIFSSVKVNKVNKNKIENNNIAGAA